jgi:outer membrane lipoprotein-sorting protein
LAIVLALLALAGKAGGAPAAPAAETARALLDRVHELNETTRRWTDRVQQLDLTIIDRRGGQRKRELEILTKKLAERSSRSILFFHTPPPIRGTRFLQWIDSGEPDRQWLYLPALKRVRQITGASRQESFVGTDFSYEDLAIMAEIFDWTEEEAASSLAGDQTLDGRPCAVIELSLREADAGYQRIRVWLDREELVARKLEFEVEAGRLEKTLVFSDIRPVGAIPSAHRLEMRSEKSGSRTVVVFTEIRYDTNLPDDVFSQRRLERGA